MDTLQSSCLHTLFLHHCVLSHLKTSACLGLQLWQREPPRKPSQARDTSAVFRMQLHGACLPSSSNAKPPGDSADSVCLQGCWSL